jgi:hypothetical protein
MSRRRATARDRCYICGRKLSRNSLIEHDGEMVSMYEYVLKNGERKSVCVTCFNKIIGGEFMDKIREKSNINNIKTYDE